MSEESINIWEKSESIKSDIEDCYRGAIKYLELYNNALLRHAGNHKIYYIGFVSKFQSLYYFTKVDGNMKRETGNDDKTLLLDEVDKWFNNDVKGDKKEGIKLFLDYANALFDRSILSFKK